MMKNFLAIVFILFSLVSYSQQTIGTCSGDRTQYIYMTSSSEDGQFSWYIDGAQDLSSFSNYIEIDWSQYGIGFHTIEVEFISDLTCQSDLVSYRVNIEECQEPSIYIPEAFTPNGDNVNDIWYPKFKNVISGEIMIFNRWGELIYEGNNINAGWDGFYQNQICPDGVYVYRIEYIDINNVQQVRIGNIVLIR